MGWMEWMEWMEWMDECGRKEWVKDSLEFWMDFPSGSCRMPRPMLIMAGAHARVGKRASRRLRANRQATAPCCPPFVPRSWGWGETAVPARSNFTHLSNERST